MVSLATTGKLFADILSHLTVLLGHHLQSYYSAPATHQTALNFQENSAKKKEEKKRKRKSKKLHDGGAFKLREFLKEELVQVKMTVLGQNWKWVSGVVHSRLSTIDHLVYKRTENSILSCRSSFSIVCYLLGARPYITTIGFVIVAHKETC